MENKTIFKRLGFLLSLLSPDKIGIIEYCLQNISKGNSQLDPTLKGNRLIKKWRLWIPQDFDELTQDIT
jgi:predicted transcriptional regulator of viral defense system